MFPVWDFVVGIIAQKAMLNMGWVLSILSCQYLYNKYINEINKLQINHKLIIFFLVLWFPSSDLKDR